MTPSDPSPIGHGRVGIRFGALDSMRGFASLFVVLTHLSVVGIYMQEPLWSHIKWMPFRILWSGHQAVIFFFVLSGFSLYVMSSSIVRDPRWLWFVVSRVCRLYPVFLASIGFALAIYAIEKSAEYPALPPSFFPSGVVTSRDILNHILMIGFYNPNIINPPIWSIVYEMRISLIFPFCYLLISRFGFLALVTSIGISLLIGSTLVQDGHASRYVINRPALLDMLLSLHYTTMFVCGGFIAKHREVIATIVGRLSRPVKVGITVIALLLYVYPFDFGWSQGIRIFGDLGIAVGSSLLIALGIAFPHALSSFLPRYLGKISYSLYLVHFPCLGLVVSALGVAITPVMIWPAVLVLSLACATGMYFAVERPSVELARRIRTSKPGATETVWLK